MGRAGGDGNICRQDIVAVLNICIVLYSTSESPIRCGASVDSNHGETQ